MSFKESLQILGIEDYAERIWKSNSRGELFYLEDYIYIAELVKDAPEPKAFRHWFEKVVKFAEDNWQRPESIFQHIWAIFDAQIDEEANK